MRLNSLLFTTIAALLLAGCSREPQSSSLSKAIFYQKALSKTGLHYRPQFVALKTNDSLKIYIIYDKDISALQGIPMEALWLANTNVADISVLSGMPLRCLLMNNTQVSDLTPITNCPIELLDIRSSQVRDLSPIEHLPLHNLGFTPKTITNGMDMLRGMTNIALINKHPPERFWKFHDFRRDLFSGKLDGDTSTNSLDDLPDLPDLPDRTPRTQDLEKDGEILEPQIEALPDAGSEDLQDL